MHSTFFSASSARISDYNTFSYNCVFCWSFYVIMSKYFFCSSTLSFSDSDFYSLNLSLSMDISWSRSFCFINTFDYSCWNRASTPIFCKSSHIPYNIEDLSEKSYSSASSSKCYRNSRIAEDNSSCDEIFSCFIFLSSMFNLFYTDFMHYFRYYSIQLLR